MKVAYLKVVDPIAWTKPDAEFYEEDVPFLVLHYIRVAGLIIYEDANLIIIGEITCAEDNPKLDEFGIKFPRYRYVEVVNKKDIVDRQDFEVEEK